MNEGWTKRCENGRWVDVELKKIRKGDLYLNSEGERRRATSDARLSAGPGSGWVVTGESSNDLS